MVRKPNNANRALIVLYIGDVVGRIGRRCVAKVLPELIEEYRPDLVVANAENLAHGKGVTKDTFKELLDAGVTFCTSGNHIFSKEEALGMLDEKKTPLIRPANYPPGTPGKGSVIIEVGTRKVLLVNLQGRVFMKEGADDPFRAFDSIYSSYEDKKLSAIIVDFHAEATSEKVAFGWYVEGRASAVVGTHTHVATADEWILPGGTAYVTDLGMCGGRDTVIGRSKEEVLHKFQSLVGTKFELPEEGHCRFNSVLIEIDPATGKATDIERIDREVEIL
ncbi:MAG: TIGR00282 family metallophosphoesterase [Candidatus Kerfeldbacteria bacterium]